MNFKYFANEIFQDKNGNIPIQFAEGHVFLAGEVVLIPGAPGLISRVISATTST